MWRRSAEYLKKIGGVILIASVIFWALSYFPRDPEPAKRHSEQAMQTSKDYDLRMSLLSPDDSSKKAELLSEKNEALHQLSLLEKREQKEHSYLGTIGRFIEPVIRPLGFDWRIGISIISGIPAKEIIVSSLSILFQADDGGSDQNNTLVGKLKSYSPEKGEKSHPGTITPLIALSFMVFVLLYLPCIGTLTAISRESGSWKWGAFMLVYSFSVAWLISFIIYQTGTLLGY
jgi:ferrous iron transport protein B